MAFLSKTDIAISKVHSNGRVIIPSDVRKKLDIEDGDKVLWFWLGIDQQLCLEKVKTVEKDKPRGRYTPTER